MKGQPLQVWPRSRGRGEPGCTSACGALPAAKRGPKNTGGCGAHPRRGLCGTELLSCWQRGNDGCPSTSRAGCGQPGAPFIIYQKDGQETGCFASSSSAHGKSMEPGLGPAFSQRRDFHACLQQPALPRGWGSWWHAEITNPAAFVMVTSSQKGHCRGDGAISKRQ